MRSIFISIVLAILFLNQSNGEEIIDSLQNGNMKCYFQGSNAHNNLNEHFSTKTSYFSVQNEDTAEITIDGMYFIIS
jgi:hypothetical protein